MTVNSIKHNWLLATATWSCIVYLYQGSFTIACEQIRCLFIHEYSSLNKKIATLVWSKTTCFALQLLGMCVNKYMSHLDEVVEANVDVLFDYWCCGYSRH